MNKVLVTGEEQYLPEFQRLGDAGCDLRAAQEGVILPYSSELVPTGISIALPEGWVGLVHPRSGLALKHGVTVLNAPGTIDANYRGEVGVILHNTSNRVFAYEKGDRIAQLLFQKVEYPEFAIVKELPESNRGAEGFGSSGVK